MCKFPKFPQNEAKKGRICCWRCSRAVSQDHAHSLSLQQWNSSFQHSKNSVPKPAMCGASVSSELADLSVAWQRVL